MHETRDAKSGGTLMVRYVVRFLVRRIVSRLQWRVAI